MNRGYRERWNNISHMWTNGILDTLPDSFTDNISPSRIDKKLKLIIKDLTADLLRLFRKDNIPKGKVWFFVQTKNNFDALEPIKRLTENSILVSFFRFRSTINTETFYFNLRLKIFWDLVYPVKWLYYALKYPKKARMYYDYFFAVNGTFQECKRLINKNKPIAIVFTNDHLLHARALLLAAKECGVRTYYVQHASVSEFFPPLEFDHAMLDGQDALDKYAGIGPIQGEVHLVGMAKFDSYAQLLNKSKVARCVGIAYNLVDEIQDVLELVEFIKQRCPDIELILRPHPGDTRLFPEVDCTIKISDSKKEMAFDFLGQLDVLISGDSSILLEAVMLNIYPLYFNFSTTVRFDFYGFVRNGLVEHFKTPEEIGEKLSCLMKEKPFIQDRAIYYNASINSEFYGNSTARISRIIKETLSGQ